MSPAPRWASRTALAVGIASAALTAASCTDRAAPPLAPRPPHAFGFYGCQQPNGENLCPPQCPDPAGCGCGADGRDPSCAAPTNPPAVPPPAGDSTAARLRIVAAQGPNPERSFTTRTAERALSLTADVRPSALAGTVTWTVVDDPTDDVHSAAPPVAPPNGASATVDVPAQTTTRWRLPHGAPWTAKALAFKVVAEALGVTGGTPLRDSTVVRQREVDVLRQEYADFKIPVPDAGETRTAADIAGLTRFGWSELNQGDYRMAVLTPVLLAKLNELDASAGRTLSLSSVFRNPAHHRIHAVVSGGARVAQLSQHQYGTAVDIRTYRNVASWNHLRELAKRAQACAEPLNISTSDHVHADWRPGAPACPKGW